MTASNPATRLSVALVDVEPGREEGFVQLAQEMARLMHAKQCGSANLIPDERHARRFYDVRHWANAEAAARWHGDPESQALWTRFKSFARLTYLINGVAPGATAAGEDRRTQLGPDRRLGFERRVSEIGRADGDKRMSPDRRIGPRRAPERTTGHGLVAAARRARENAEAAYSHFKVGAAIETADGSVITGCNVENATYGLTVCAERVAMFKALSEGHRAFARIAIVADTEAPTPPCGACRQILWEFGGNLEVTLANLNEQTGTYRLRELLPLPFDARLL